MPNTDPEMQRVQMSEQYSKPVGIKIKPNFRWFVISISAHKYFSRR